MGIAEVLRDVFPDVPENWRLLLGVLVGSIVALWWAGWATILWLTRRPESINDVGALNPGRVTGVVGVMGSGKSYYAARMVHRLLAEGRNVAGNFDFDDTDLRGTYVKITGWEDFVFVQNCTVVVDEAHTWASASAHQSFPMEVRAFVSTMRHYGKELVWISQHQDRVNKTLRELTEVVVSVRSKMDARVFIATEWDIDELGKKQVVDAQSGKMRRTKPRRRDVYLFRFATASLYDTHEIMGVDGHVKNSDQIEAWTAWLRAQDRDSFKLVPMPVPDPSLSAEARSDWYRRVSAGVSRIGAGDGLDRSQNGHVPPTDDRTDWSAP